MRFIEILSAAAIAVTLAMMPPVQAAEDSLTPEKVQEFEALIRDYILKHPEVIIESMRLLQAKEKAMTESRAKEMVVSRRNEIVNDPTSPVGGNPNGNVTVVEFFDYRCGYCKRVFPDLQKLIRDDGNIRYVYKEFPILGPQSLFASRAALAAWKLDQKKYHLFHNAMMASKGNLTEAKTMKFAVSVGFDEKTLRDGMADPAIEATLKKNFQLAKDLNINGTPAFVIGNELVPGAVSLEALQQLVAAARRS